MKHLYFLNWKTTTTLVFAAFLNDAASGQGRLIEGKVTAAAETTGIPGVAIVVKGTQVGSLTDADGE
jgi:hypothetical protein